MSTASEPVGAGTPVDFSDWVAAQIRAYAAFVRVSQREIARRLGRPVPWVNTRMVGHVSVSARDLEAIAAALGTTPMRLLTEGQAPPAGPVAAVDNGGSTTHRYVARNRHLVGIDPLVGASRVPGPRRPRDAAARPLLAVVDGRNDRLPSVLGTLAPPVPSAVGSA